jgi:predicted amidohydrolase
MKIALVQLNIQWESKKLNHRHAEEFIKKAFLEGCDIVVFPEMFNSGFSMNISAIAEDEDGETSLFLSRLAIKYNISLIAGYTVKSICPGKGRNQAVVYDRQGRLVEKFVKLHSFAFANEDQYYSAGNKIVTFDIEGMVSSIFICFDLRFPEVFRRIAKKVQAIFVLANWPSARTEHWEALLKARAIENQCFVIGVNRTGRDGNGIDYSGKSKIFGPLGNEICSGKETEELLIGEIFPHEVSEIRKKFPFLDSMGTI